VHAVGPGAESLVTASGPLLFRPLDDARTALADAGPLLEPTLQALQSARSAAPAVRTHVSAELERRPLRAQSEEAR
jgi:hypothetical protein